MGDIEIAQKAKLERIGTIAEKVGIKDDYLEQYGKYKAKVDLKIFDELKERKNGKLILVTSINPTPLGEGKTTILRLILGLVNKTEGELKLRVDNFGELSVSPATRRFCSYVPQENAVFSGTVAENLRIVNPNATDDELKEALKIADALEFIEKTKKHINIVIYSCPLCPNHNIILKKA